MDFNKKLSLILESTLLQDGEYTIEDDQPGDQPEIQDPDALPDEDKFGGVDRYYYLKKNGQEIAQLIIYRENVITILPQNFNWSDPEYETKYCTTQKAIAKLPITKRLMATQYPHVIVHYSRFWLGERFPEGEPRIMTDPYAACSYAKWILKKRWPEAEPIIQTNPSIWKLYQKSFKSQ